MPSSNSDVSAAVEDFERIQARRHAQSGTDRRKGGRPSGPGYLLSGLAVCGVCGSRMDAATSSWVRKDGTRARRYICRRHRQRPGSCQKPIDAEAVDLRVVPELKSILGDVEGIRQSLADAHGAERKQFEQQASKAQEDKRKAEAGAERLAVRIAALAAAGENEKAEALEQALAVARSNARAAEVRRDAAMDNLAAPPPEDQDEAAFYTQLNEELTGRRDAAKGKAKRLNVTLGDFLGAVELTQTDEGVRVLPRLSPAAGARILGDLEAWPHPVAFAVVWADTADDDQPVPVPGVTARHVARNGQRGVMILDTDHSDYSEGDVRRGLADGIMRLATEIDGPEAFETGLRKLPPLL
jgi:hypothetical protein